MAILVLFVLIQYQHVTDGWTDEQTSVPQKYAIALVRSDENVAVLGTDM